MDQEDLKALWDAPGNIKGLVLDGQFELVGLIARTVDRRNILRGNCPDEFRMLSDAECAAWIFKPDIDPSSV